MKSPLLFFIIALYAFSAAAQPEQNDSGRKSQKYIPTEKTIYYRLGERELPITIAQYGEENGIFCINLHANEFTSVIAARSVLEETGGTLIKIENENNRVIRFRTQGSGYAFDPNRIYSREGIEQTLKDNGRISMAAIDETEKFAQRLLLLLTDTPSCIIALHNNTDEAFSVRSYLPGNNREKDARLVYADSLQDVDDIALTTDSLLYQAMAERGFNSIWQDNENAVKDGSLSVYCGEKKFRYINIETQHGKTEQYRDMLLALFSILSKEK